MFYGVPGGLSGSQWGTQDSNGVWSGWNNQPAQQVAAYDPGAGAAFGGQADAYTGNPGAYTAQMPAPVASPSQQMAATMGAWNALPSAGNSQYATFGGAPSVPMAGDMSAGGSMTFNGGPGGLGGAYQPGIANDPMGGGSVGANPYMGSQIGYLSDVMGRALQRNLQGIRSNAVGTGNLGSSRQGIAEGEAFRGFADALGGNVANMLGQNYQFDRSLNTGSYNTNRALDLQQAGLGLNAMNQGLGMQWSPLQNANSIYTPYSGLGSQSTPAQGGGWQGGLGGALAAAQLARNFGLW